MADGLDDVAGARLALRAEHRRSFRNTPLRKKGEKQKHNTRRDNETQWVKTTKKKETFENTASSMRKLVTLATWREEVDTQK